jgi:hypothetical protein
MGLGVGVAAKIVGRLAIGAVDAQAVRDALVWSLRTKIEHFVRRGMKYSDPMGTEEDVQRRVEDRARLCSVRGGTSLLSPLHDILIEQLFEKAAVNDPVAAVDFVHRTPARPAKNTLEVKFDPPAFVPPPPEAPKGEWLGAPLGTRAPRVRTRIPRSRAKLPHIYSAALDGSGI